MQKKGKIILAVIALLVLCGLLYWVTRPQDKGLTATGTVEATRYDVTAKVPGYVRELTLQAGDTLNEGDLVCRIDREDLRAQRASGSGSRGSGTLAGPGGCATGAGGRD